MVLQAPPVPSTTTVHPCPWRLRGPVSFLKTANGGGVCCLGFFSGWYLTCFLKCLRFLSHWGEDVTNYNQIIAHLWQQRTFSILPGILTSLRVGTSIETCWALCWTMITCLYTDTPGVCWWHHAATSGGHFCRRQATWKVWWIGKSWRITAALSQLDEFHFRCEKWINHQSWWGLDIIDLHFGHWRI